MTDEKAGLGVNYTAAMAYAKVAGDNKPIATNSAFKNANNTEPLPCKMAAIFKGPKTNSN